jgi:hypothetical protein
LRVSSTRTPRRGRHEARRQRGDARQPLHEVERRALARQQRARATLELEHDRRRSRAARRRGGGAGRRPRIEALEHAHEHVGAREDAVGACDQARAGAGLGRNERLARHVAGSDVLGERGVEQTLDAAPVQGRGLSRGVCTDLTR